MRLPSNVILNIEKKLQTKDLSLFVEEWMFGLVEKLPLLSHIDFKMYSREQNFVDDSSSAATSKSQIVAAEIYVYSPGLEICVKKMNADFFQALDELITEVEKQIRRWRLLRFKPHTDDLKNEIS